MGKNNVNKIYELIFKYIIHIYRCRNIIEIYIIFRIVTFIIDRRFIRALSEIL